MADAIPDHEYQVLERDLNLKHPILISAALNKFVESYRNKQCDFIDVRRIVNIFISWIDEQLTSGSQSVHQLWYVEYYMIELLVLLDSKNEVLERLEIHIRRENSKARNYRDLMLNSDESFKS